MTIPLVMTITTPLATALPEHSNDGYVAAAYIVFLAIVLIYVAIMALRLSHVERDLRGLQARAERPRPEAGPGETPSAAPGRVKDEADERAPDEAHESDSGQTRERETV